MKRERYLFGILFAGLLFICSSSSYAQGTTVSPAPDVDGYVWMKTTDPEKKAFLFGAGTAIALEYQMRVKHGEEPSRFVKGWIDVFQDMTWAEMATTIDKYYEANPDKSSRLVLDVMWHEMIKPNWKK